MADFSWIVYFFISKFENSGFSKSNNTVWLRGNGVWWNSIFGSINWLFSRLISGITRCINFMDRPTERWFGFSKFIQDNILARNSEVSKECKWLILEADWCIRSRWEALWQLVTWNARYFVNTSLTSVSSNRYHRLDRYSSHDAMTGHFLQQFCTREMCNLKCGKIDWTTAKLVGHNG